MKSIRLFGFLIVSLALVAGCGSAAGAGAPASGTLGPARNAAAGAEALQFTATTLQGSQFAGQSLAGKPAALWFWAPWCAVCQHEAPSVAKAAQANPGVTFVGVAAQDQLPAMKEFVAKYHMGSFTHLADLNGSVWQRFGVTQQPAFAFIRPDGTVDVVKGTLSEQALTERLHGLART
ncbi:MAG: thiol:disulfide interchange protein [Pseudonocardiales bacterium]|nr:MAG: thiol:disulfide interchange protein [Pseudonocardiales bacterium]